MKIKYRGFNIFGFAKDMVFSYLNGFKNITLLATLEAKIAYKSLLQMILIYILMAVLTLSTWFSVLFFIYQGLIYYNVLPIAAAGILIAINLILLGIVYYFSKATKSNINFDATRRQLDRMIHGKPAKLTKKSD